MFNGNNIWIVNIRQSIGSIVLDAVTEEHPQGFGFDSQ